MGTYKDWDAIWSAYCLGTNAPIFTGLQQDLWCYAAVEGACRALDTGRCLLLNPPAQPIQTTKASQDTACCYMTDEEC